MGLPTPTSDNEQSVHTASPGLSTHSPYEPSPGGTGGREWSAPGYNPYFPPTGTM